MDGVAARDALLVAVLVVAVAIGLWRRRTDGRAHRVDDRALSAADLGSALGRTATLLQFSTLEPSLRARTRLTISGSVASWMSACR